jgi:hypothetical protein
VLVAAVFAPHPPLVVPEVAAGAAGELAVLRAACDRAVRRLLATGPDRVVVVGAGPAAARWVDGDSGTFAGYGVALDVPLGPGPALGPPRMPLSATVGGWLLARAGYAGPRYAVTVPAGVSDPELAGWARSVESDGVDAGGVDAGGVDAGGVDAGGRLGLLVMGDGSARRSLAGPGYLDPRAEGFDAAVARALREGDPAGLRALDPLLGAELLAAGVPAWRLAGQVGQLGPSGRFRTELLYDDAPYGVGYLVAVWVAVWEV